MRKQMNEQEKSVISVQSVTGVLFLCCAHTEPLTSSSHTCHLVKGIWQRCFDAAIDSFETVLILAACPPLALQNIRCFLTFQKMLAVAHCFYIFQYLLLIKISYFSFLCRVL